MYISLRVCIIYVISESLKGKNNKKLYSLYHKTKKKLGDAQFFPHYRNDNLF